VIASNTSSLPLERLAAALRRPERFLAMHFFNPVDRMPLVEIAAVPATSAGALAGAVELAKRLRKTPVVVRNRPGFLVNRVLFPYLMEAARVLEEGGDWQALDRELAAWGMPMGPFRLIDEIGLDVTVNIARSLAASFDARMAPPPFLHRLVERGAVGRKAGAGTGFYRYAGREAVADEDSVAAAVAVAASPGAVAGAGRTGEPSDSAGGAVADTESVADAVAVTASSGGVAGAGCTGEPSDSAGGAARATAAGTSANGSRRTAQPPESADGVARCLAMLVNEAARCLAERIVDRPLYLDLTLLLGIGFPDHRGGVLRYADQYGLRRQVERMEELRERYGARFRPCAELSTRAATGTAFYGTGQ
jgi:3-hydroxyacyl-CoA dehydrogenase